jgi:hypothetical protein
MPEPERAEEGIAEVGGPPVDAPVLPETVPSSGQVPRGDQLKERLLQLVSDRTGYPPEMLGLEVDMEADLGIDSIKRVEILGVMQKASFPQDHQVDPVLVEELNACRTLGAVLEWFERSACRMKGRPPAPARNRKVRLLTSRTFRDSSWSLSSRELPPVTLIRSRPAACT